MKNKDHEDWLPMFGAGILVGFTLIVIAIVTTEFNLSAFERMESTDWATIFGAFGAVVVGGWISWLLQTKAAKNARRDAQAQAEDDKKELRKAQAISLIGKMQIIASGFMTERKYFWDARNLANDAGMVSEPLWIRLRPQVSTTFPSPLFTAEEFLPLIAARRAPLVNDCQELASLYNVVENAMRVFSDKREEMQKLMLPHSKFNGPGKPITTEAPYYLGPILQIKEAEVEQLAQDAYKMIRDGVAQSRTLIGNLQQGFNEYFGKGFIELQFPDDWWLNRSSDDSDPGH